MILPGMFLQGLVDATETALGCGRDLFGPAPQSTGWASTSGLHSLRGDLSRSVDTVPASWRGSGGEAYQKAGGAGILALDNVIDADNQVTPRVGTAAEDARNGRSGMTTVVNDTRSGVNAIAPSTDTPAGKTVMVNHLEGQLDRAKALLTKSEQRGQLLAAMIRNAGGGYGASPMRAGMPMGGSMPLSGMGARQRVCRPWARWAD